MIKCKREAGTNKIECIISGEGDDVALEYATIMMALLDSENGQKVIDKVTEIMKKEINDYEEKRRS